VNAPTDYNSYQLYKSDLTFCVFLKCSLKNQPFFRRVVHQLFKSNLTFCVVCVFNLQFEKSVSGLFTIDSLTPTSSLIERL
jgi:hypothetical protein